MFASPVLTKTFQLSAVAMALALAGCGSGGGGHNDTVQPAINTGSGSSSGTTSGSTTTAAVNSSAITLTDASGATTQTISAAGATAKVKITDASGKGISGALVTFSGTGVTFGTTNGSVLTNANGEASISVKPTSATDTGSYSMTATATYNGTTATSAGYNYSLQAANTSISGMNATTTSLASGGSTNITLSTVDATTNTAQNNVGVAFTTSCGTFTSNSATSSSQGNVTTTYKAVDANGNLCSGAQTITATTASGTTQTLNVTIAAIQASSIVYTTSSNVQMGVKGSGSSSSGQIEFTVYANGVPAANQSVIVNKNYAPTDFSFVTLGNQAAQTVQSDSNGKVIVMLYPGSVPGPVEIQATLASNTNVSALSKNVSVATGRATQNGMSISMSKNVLQKGVDGDTATVTARLADRNGNAVPDGTVVSFVAEGGSITPNCSTTSGACSVTFTVQDPRPTDDRVSVIAYVEGDKSYTDVNADNQYTVGTDILTSNIGDIFRDDNENNAYDTGEYVYKRGASGATCAASSFVYPNIAGTCDNNLSAVLRYQTVLGLAQSTPVYDTLPDKLSVSSPYTFKMYGNSAETVSMPSGTSITVVSFNNTDSCKPYFSSGSAPVSAVVGLNGGTGKVDDASVTYTLDYSKCEVGDQIQVITSTPAPNVVTTTRTIILTQ